jgi:hypothetical protein
MSRSAKKYEPLLDEGKEEPEDSHQRGRPTIDYGDLQLPMNASRKDDQRTIRLLVALNVTLAALLLVLVIVLWREKSRARAPAAPYSPAWEAVQYVNRRFEKDERFYRENETDREVDLIWLNLTGREYTLLWRVTVTSGW